MGAKPVITIDKEPSQAPYPLPASPWPQSWLTLNLQSPPWGPNPPGNSDFNTKMSCRLWVSAFSGPGPREKQILNQWFGGGFGWLDHLLQRTITRGISRITGWFPGWFYIQNGLKTCNWQRDCKWSCTWIVGHLSYSVVTLQGSEDIASPRYYRHTVRYQNTCVNVHNIYIYTLCTCKCIITYSTCG